MKPLAPFYCQECGRAFRTVRAAERALNDGCPKCGGCDVDVLPPPPSSQRATEAPGFELKLRPAFNPPSGDAGSES